MADPIIAVRGSPSEIPSQSPLIGSVRDAPSTLSPIISVRGAPPPLQKSEDDAGTPSPIISVRGAPPPLQKSEDDAGTRAIPPTGAGADVREIPTRAAPARRGPAHSAVGACSDTDRAGASARHSAFALVRTSCEDGASVRDPGASVLGTRHSGVGVESEGRLEGGSVRADPAHAGDRERARCRSPAGCLQARSPAPVRSALSAEAAR